MLCCAVLCCAVLCCAVLCCAELSCAVLCCAERRCFSSSGYSVLPQVANSVLPQHSITITKASLFKKMLLIMLQGINNFCREIGITRTGGELPLHILDFHVRADLHLTSPRTLAVLRPLKLVITNLPENHYEMVDAKVAFP